MLSLNLLDSAIDDVRIAEVHVPVAIQVIHAAVAIGVDDDVRGIAVLVAAGVRATLEGRAPIVLWRAETRQHHHVAGRDALHFERRQDEFQLVQELFAHNDVLRPDVVLVVRDEAAQREVSG